MLAAILREIQQIPPAKQSESAALQKLKVADFPKMPKAKLAEYADDGFNPFTQKLKGDALQKARDEHPLRVAVFEAASKIRETMDLPMPEFIPKAAGLDERSRKKFLSERKGPALEILDLQEMFEDLTKLDEDRAKEKSKRWLAHFDLAKARLLLRLIHIYEYDNLIAPIRNDKLPPLDEIPQAWLHPRIAQRGDQGGAGQEDA